MRTIKQYPVVRVKTSRPIIAPARQRWRDRMEYDQQQRRQLQEPALRRNSVDSLPDARRDDDCCRRDSEEREPTMNECAPLHFSQGRDHDERGDGSTDNSTGTQERRCQQLTQENVRPLTCQVLEDNNHHDKINLLGLLQNSPGAFAAAAQNTGEVKSIDCNFRSMEVVAKRQRQRAQKGVLQEKSVATRRRILMNVLGMQKFYKMLSLVREIKSLRVKLLRSCSDNHHGDAPSCDGSDEQQQHTSAKDKVRAFKKRFECLPKSGRDLLQNTNLVAAVEQTEMEQLGKLPWEDIIQQAQQNLYAYREWTSITETRE